MRLTPRLRDVLVSHGIFVTALCVGSGPVKAQTASEYLGYCEQFEVSTAQQSGGQLILPNGGPMDCWHFFVAFRELADLIDADTRRPILGLCIPNSVPTSQVIRVFVSYAEEHPEILQTLPAIAALQAVWQSYGCNKPQ